MPPAPSPFSTRARADPGGGRPLVILVAEDEAPVALVLHLALAAAGHRVLGPAARQPGGAER